MFATNPASPPKKQAVETACFLLSAGISHGKSRAVALQREPLRLHAIDLR
jgi:hypothetical protein